MLVSLLEKPAFQYTMNVKPQSVFTLLFHMSSLIFTPLFVDVLSIRGGLPHGWLFVGE